MLSRNAAWGIDIGHSAIKAVKLARTKTGVNVVDFDTQPFAQPLPKGGVDADIRDCLAMFLSRHKLKSEVVGVSMPGHAAFYRLISLPAVETKKISQLVQFEARQMIPFPIEDVVWDYQPLGDLELTEEMEVGLFAIKKEIIYSFLANLRACQMKVNSIQIAPLAAYNFLRYENPEGGPMIVLDMGAENTDLIVSDGHKLWLRNLHVAGSHLTRALQKRFRISVEEAEELKQSLSSQEKADSTQGKKVFGVVQPVLAELVSEIQRSIGFYKSQAVDVQFDKIMVLGDAFKSEVLLEHLRASLKYEMEVVRELSGIGMSPKIDADQFAAGVPAFGVALGLALQGLGFAEMKVNLLPPEYLVGDVVSRKKPLAAAAAAALVLGTGLSYLSSFSTAQRYDELVQKAPDITKDVQSCEGKYTAIEGEIADNSPMMVKLKERAGLGGDRTVWLGVLQQLERVIPRNDVWLTKMSVQPTVVRTSRVMPASPTGNSGGQRPAEASAPGKVEEVDRSSLRVEILGYARNTLGIMHVKNRLVAPLQKLPFTLPGTKINTYTDYSRLSNASRLPAETKVEVLEFSMTWLIDTEDLMAEMAKSARGVAASRTPDARE